MPINYVVRKKKDQSGNEVKELYYAVPSAIQNKGVSEKQLAEDLHDNSSRQATYCLYSNNSRKPSHDI